MQERVQIGKCTIHGASHACCLRQRAQRLASQCPGGRADASVLPLQMQSPRPVARTGKQWQTSSNFRDSACSAASTTVDPSEEALLDPFHVSSVFAWEDSAVDDEATSESLSSCENQCSRMVGLGSSNRSKASTDTREMSRASSPTCPESAAHSEHRGILKAARSEKSQERLGAADACDDADFFCSAKDLSAARSTWADATRTEWSRSGSAERRLHLAREAHPWCHRGGGETSALS